MANEEVHARFLLNILLKSCVKPTHETDPVIPNSESKGSQRSVIKALFSRTSFTVFYPSHTKMIAVAAIKFKFAKEL